VADLYGITPADIAAELPGLFPNGFSAGTRPKDTDVAKLITTADTIARLRIAKATQVAANAVDPTAMSAEVAKRFIKDWVEAKIVRIVYTGQAPRDVDLAAKSYEDARELGLETIDELGEQAQDPAGTPVDRVRGTDGSLTRDLLISDETLGYGARGGGKVRPF
jgi:hypothetical protein